MATIGRLIRNFSATYNENLLPASSLFDNLPTITKTAGVASANVSFDNRNKLIGLGDSKNINVYNNDVSTDLDFNFGSAFTTTLKDTGYYYITLFVRNSAIPTMTFNDKLILNIFQNGILFDTMECDFELCLGNSISYCFWNSFSFSSNDVIDFTFTHRVAPSSPSGFSRIWIDGIKLELNNKKIPFPTSFSKPIKSIQNLGTYDYANSLPSQSFTGTALKINNNGGGANTNLNFKFDAIPNIFNTTTNFLEFDALELGDKVDVRADLTITTTTANQDVDIYLDVALGTGSNYQIFLCRRNFKTAGTYSVNDISNWLYIGNTDTKDYNCALMFDSDANATVLNNGMVINVTKRVV